jgi:hypothetical protein
VLQCSKVKGCLYIIIYTKDNASALYCDTKDKEAEKEGFLEITLPYRLESMYILYSVKNRMLQWKRPNEKWKEPNTVTERNGHKERIKRDAEIKQNAERKEPRYRDRKRNEEI